jgi:hypothetical protein
MTKIPEGAIFEADLGTDPFGCRWALYDVSEILPVNQKRGGYPTRADGIGTKPKYAQRKLTAADVEIIRVYNHHSGAKGRDGFAGLKASVGYSTRDKKKTRVVKSGPNKGTRREYTERGWPGGPYTFWNCVKADMDAEGRKVIYRVNKDELRTYHTGSQANDHGVGLAWQGNLTVIKPSQDQIGGATVLNAYCVVRYKLSENKPFSWHSESKEFGGSGKAACPGPHVEAFVGAYRDKLVHVDLTEEDTSSAGSLRGPRGPAGPAGPPGPRGPAGPPGRA